MGMYEVNKDTLAIISRNNYSSVIYEHDKKYIVGESANKIMEYSCEYFGSSFRGRQLGSTSLTGITHKVPIIIEESNNIIFFPTTSPRLKECSWISLNNIDSYKRDEDSCVIKFKDGKILKLNTTYGIINNQILRASRLQMMLTARKTVKMNKKVQK